MIDESEIAPMTMPIPEDPIEVICARSIIQIMAARPRRNLRYLLKKNIDINRNKATNSDGESAFRPGGLHFEFMIVQYPIRARPIASQREVEGRLSPEIFERGAEKAAGISTSSPDAN
jgi:hypothetical protein